MGLLHGSEGGMVDILIWSTVDGRQLELPEFEQAGDEKE